MILNDQLALVIIWFCVGCIWCFYTGPYRRYRIDLLRDRLFIVRDELFEAAVAAKERGVEDPFGTKAYGLTRLTINGMIHFAHEVSLMDLLFSKVMLGRLPDHERDLLMRITVQRAEAVEAIEDEEFKESLELALVATNLMIFSHMLNTSYLFGCIVHPLKWIVQAVEVAFRPFRALRKGYKRAKKTFEDTVVNIAPIQQLDSEAELIAANDGGVYACAA